MRIYLVLALIALTKAQASNLSMPSELTKDFGDADQHLEDLNDKINAQKVADYEAEKKKRIDQFLLDAQDALDEHVSLTQNQELGKFNVIFQSKCVLEMPELNLPEEPHLIDCLQGKLSAKFLAESVTRISKDTLKNPAQAIGALHECELLMQHQLTFSLYGNCFEGEFEEHYKQYFDEFVEQMRQKDFEYDPVTNKFVYQSDKIVVDRQTGETRLIDNTTANQISL